MKFSKILYPCIWFLLLAFLTGCASNSVSTIHGVDYDDKNDQTDYFVVPYGNVTIPGKWEKSNYISSSKQQFFENNEAVSIAIAFGPCDKFDFNLNRDKTGWDFVKAYYEWDSNFFVKKLGLDRELIEEDKTNNFILWRLFGSTAESQFDIYFLFGEKGCIVHNYSVQNGKNWSVNQRVIFLKNLYLNVNE